MASPATTAMHLLAVVLLAASPAATRAGGGSVCGGEKFPAGVSYATCADLPALGATLHWTYDGTAATLSVAFVARPPAAGGWVSWAVNPTGDGMKGSQALVAFRGGASGSGAYVVNTYNVTGYQPFPGASTPIAFNATGLAADESAAGKVRLYGKLQLPRGMETVNHIWQVGSTVTGGVPMKHAFAQENLDAKGTLSLTGHGAMEPAPAPVAGGPSAEAENVVAAPSPSPSGKNAAATYTPAPALMILALAGFLALV
ncbi:auxin-induced in root cultures protein 12-like [Oryza brachyantha]|uniref:auxin-induced in root cultures protein 12-like n=1 Tax=Oryza brachyantha TaxID=4533 RepID=UPI001AD9C8B4|nr:auxin-induced in root cultures protein 12-like [Oryza brachyantha]